VVHVCVEGAYNVTYNGETYPLKMGECILLPKSIDKIELETTGGFKILESYIE
jgi:mannose-6-phosphate isomerase